MMEADFFITIQSFLAKNFFFDEGVFFYLLCIKGLTDRIIFQKNHYIALTGTLHCDIV